MQEGTSAEKVVGKPMDRVDGKLKVTGGAKYAFEFEMPNQARAVILDSTIARGRIRRMDTKAAERAPGVLAVITHENEPKTSLPTNPPAGDSKPLLSPEILQQGQHIAVVVAETFEQADYAASLIKVEYDAQKPDSKFEEHLDAGFVPKTENRPTTAKKGDADAGLAASAHRVEHLYQTGVMHHNPMEPHATSAMWQGDELTVYDATQGVDQLGGQPRATVQRGPDAGPFEATRSWGAGSGARGSRGRTRRSRRWRRRWWGGPVRLRGDAPADVHEQRPPPADAPGREDRLGWAGASCLAQKHEAWNHTSRVDEFTEPTGSVIQHLYASPESVDVSHKIVRADVPAPTYMRAPGESSGSFSIESAMDELAYELGVDPLELRLRNYSDVENHTGKPYSSNSP